MCGMLSHFHMIDTFCEISKHLSRWRYINCEWW